MGLFYFYDIGMKGLVVKQMIDRNKKDTSGFRIGTPVGLAIMALIGIGLIIVAYYCFGKDEVAGDIWLEILRFAGETLIGTAVLSAVVEMHSIKKNYENVRDYLLLEEPSFIERYSENEVDKIIDLAIKQKVRLKTKHNLEEDGFNRLVSGNSFLIKPYIDYTAEELGSNGFYCTSHRRQINITPINNEHYNIHITVEVELKNFTSTVVKNTQLYKFYYISQKQIDSFQLCSLEIDREVKKISVIKLNKYSNNKPSTVRHPFNYIVEFEIPFVIQPGGTIHYTLAYEYNNYEQSCFITYSLPYVTKSFNETYSLVGDQADEYQIHASAYTPYKNKINNRSLVQRLNSTTLSINSDNWMVPGSGFVSVVRKKLPEGQNEN